MRKENLGKEKSKGISTEVRVPFSIVRVRADPTLGNKRPSQPPPVLNFLMKI
jgi:hypothetical protein